ncbi:ABC transporter substrate-binding protein [Paenibacillus popilliae]|uniref:Extracellular solute-binding protein n=1 Tax=Paenibacillus popilliae TaxID=78057 RepID=A0ABY3AP48_PAEPP|nr:extracellular solute-binding protein [Paenibacillus sp. SDF0028]TQR44559.1 extracellular solute-binding protein [Paenibacillus sp. SDF0028]
MGKWRVTIALLLIIVLISGCAGKTQEYNESIQTSKIKVLYQNEEAYYTDIDKIKMMNYPLDQIEFIVQTNEFSKFKNGKSLDEFYEGQKKFLDKHKPDVIVVDENLFSDIAREGKLYDMESDLQENSFHLNEFMPGLIDRLKSRGDGKLYGIAPYFYRQVLFYNKDLFEKHHVDPPRSNMTWDEVLKLAGQISDPGSGKRDFHGIYHTYSAAPAMMYQIGSSSGLSLFDEKGEKLLIDTDEWKHVMKKMTEAVSSRALLVHPKERNMTHNGIFIDGDSAMLISDSSFISGTRPRPNDKTDRQLNWGVVAPPGNPKLAEANMKLPYVYAVAADSDNKQAAMEFVKFINGKKTMATYSQDFIYDYAPARMDNLKDLDASVTEPFYQLKPQKADGIWDNPNVPRDFFLAFDPILSEELQAVIDRKKTVDQAAAELKEKGQAILRQLRDKARTSNLPAK